MTLRLASLCALLCACSAVADFVGFPLASNTNAPTWYEARELYNPIGQIYSGVVERCEIVGVAVPSIVETWTVSAGTSNSVVEVVDAGVTNTYTNVVLLTDSVTTTNQIGPFEYEYTDPSGTYTNTAYPYVTSYFLNQLDTKIDALIPYFLSNHTNIYVDGSYNDWLADASDYYGQGYISDYLPEESKAGLFSREGIGFVTNLTFKNEYTSHVASVQNNAPSVVSTNVPDTNIAYVTGGDAYYTRQPSVKRDWLLSEHHYSTSGWSFVDVGTFDTRYYSDALPNVQYIQGGSNALSSINLTISGTALVQSNQSTVATSEVVSMSSSNVACTEMWYDITNIVASTTPANTGDVYAVAYTNATVLYGTRPYRLYASDLDERATVLSALTLTEEDVYVWGYGAEGGQDPSPNITNRFVGLAFGEVDESTAKSDTVTDYYDDEGIRLAVLTRASKVDYDYGGASWGYDGYLQSAFNHMYVTNISTNTPRSINLYMEAFIGTYDLTPALQEQFITIASSSGAVVALEFDADDTPLLHNQMSLLYSSPTNSDLVVESGVFGSYTAPSWPTSSVPSSPTPPSVFWEHESQRGYYSGNEKVVVKWDFDYK